MTTITRQHLEDAAKAAEINVWRGKEHQTDMLFREAQKPNEICTGIHWNPLHDGTDSQELQLKAGIEIACLGKDM
ncbi:MAG: hypothetical protein KGL39_47280, partial [Patescibacteria group bacterium]|nr:hypothetical protein [Patescibacteria group bacterium]